MVDLFLKLPAVELAQEAHEALTNGDNSPDENTSTKPIDASVMKAEGETAGQILALLSEIGSNQMLKDEFHPWFWDPSSGRLMTV